MFYFVTRDDGSLLTPDGHWQPPGGPEPVAVTGDRAAAERAATAYGGTVGEAQPVPELPRMPMRWPGE